MIFLTNKGKVLKDEAKAQIDYYQKMINLSRILPQKISTVNNDTDAVGPDKFLLTAHTGEFKESMNCCHIGHLCSHSVISQCSFCHRICTAASSCLQGIKRKGKSSD